MPKNFNFKKKDVFLRNLNKEIRALERRTHAGLIEATIVLQRAAEPGTPIDVGNLRASWFVVSSEAMVDGAGFVDAPFKGSAAGRMASRHAQIKQILKSKARSIGSASEPVAIFGYSANYAPYVHENVGATFGRPGAHARWLYKAMQESRAEMLEAIRKRARFK